MRSFILLILMVPTISFANIWGRTGHRVTGHIAEKHLTKKAKRVIKDLLDGHSLAFVSTYADEIKSDRSYSSYSPWHYVNYPLELTYAQSEKSEFGDIVVAIDKCVNVLKDENSSRTDKVFYLKFLIHLIGDLHQPMHAGMAADKGGNDIQVQWFGQGSNLHRVWDTNMLGSYGMSYYELGDELDKSVSKKQRKLIQEGTVVDWLSESHIHAKAIYGSVNIGEKLSYKYAYEYNSILFERLKKGGFRLAKVLNDIFS